MVQYEKKEQLTVNVQYIKDLSFENQNSPDSLSNKGEAPAINVDVNVFAKPLRKKAYEVSLSINSKAEKKDFKVFELELVYAGIFTLSDINLNDDKSVQVTLTPWILMTTDEEIVIPGNHVITIVEPIDSIKQMYSEKVDGSESISTDE